MVQDAMLLTWDPHFDLVFVMATWTWVLIFAFSGLPRAKSDEECLVEMLMVPRLEASTRISIQKTLFGHPVRPERRLAYPLDC